MLVICLVLFTSLNYIHYVQAHFWHQEATANGSLESQGALGVIYEHGIGVKKNLETSFKCFKSAAEKGNVYAMGNLAVMYYRNKMFNNASDVARRLVFVFLCCVVQIVVKIIIMNDSSVNATITGSPDVKN